MRIVVNSITIRIVAKNLLTGAVVGIELVENASEAMVGGELKSMIEQMVVGITFKVKANVKLNTVKVNFNLG
jgi:hypothetical protein